MRAKSQSQSETALNGINNDRRSLQHCKQSVPQRVSVGAWWRSLLDRYVNVEVGICLHFHTPFVPGQSKRSDHVFVIQKSRTSSFDRFESSTSRTSNFGAKIRRPRTHDVKCAMPVFTRPLIQDVEGAVKIKDSVFWGEFWSVVRLYRLDNVPTLLNEWTQHASLIVGVLTPFAVNRKFQMILVGGRVLSGLKNGSMIDAGIQSGSKLIKHFSQFEGEERSETFGNVWDHPNRPCPIVLHAYANGVEVFRLADLTPRLGHDFAVSLCAADTLPTALEFEKRHNGRDYTAWLA